MSEFDNIKNKAVQDLYAEEAKHRWGDTDAYKEFERKTADCSEEKRNDVNSGMNAIIAEFADAFKNGLSPESETSQSLVKKLQTYITDNYYTCTDDILNGLGQMYVADDRFRTNIDKNLNGTAKYMSEAINLYCTL